MDLFEILSFQMKKYATVKFATVANSKDILEMAVGAYPEHHEVYRSTYQGRGGEGKVFDYYVVEEFPHPCLWLLILVKAQI